MGVTCGAVTQATHDDRLLNPIGWFLSELNADWLMRLKYADWVISRDWWWNGERELSWVWCVKFTYESAVKEHIVFAELFGCRFWLNFFK